MLYNLEPAKHKAQNHKIDDIRFPVKNSILSLYSWDIVVIAIVSIIT